MHDIFVEFRLNYWYKVHGTEKQLDKIDIYTLSLILHDLA